ncbi:MAG: hypothetical protein IKW39_05750 [Alphaproteobacteria bacterium]|nr:hypothetical protein [Alphaproteobacteria bacterium]
MFNLSKIDVLVIVLMFLVLCFPDCAEASGNFGSLIKSGKTIFVGLRKIIYPASAVGIICVCIGGFFGNINWKWLTAIVIGLLVISLCAGFIAMFTPDNAAPDLG